METIFSFLLRASFGMTLFYLVYWFFLRKETFYRANRWFLLAALLMAVLLPLFPVRYTVFTELNSDTTIYNTIADTFKNIPIVNVGKSSGEIFRWEHAMLLVYLTGAAIFLLRLLTQTTILFYLAIKSKVKSIDGIRIVENEKYGLPFSFFIVVFINPKFHTQDDLPEILAHEKVHIRENHWFDLLFIELLTVIFWFNPFIWFFERSIKQNHEYLADEGVLAQGHNVGRYQALLINQLMGMQIIGITNNLNFALNKNRLKMMTKTKTSRFGGVKFAWALPVVALLLFAFAEPSYKLQTESEKAVAELNNVIQQDTNRVVLKGIKIDDSISTEEQFKNLAEKYPNGMPERIRGTSSEMKQERNDIAEEVYRIGYIEDLPKNLGDREAMLEYVNGMQERNKGTSSEMKQERNDLAEGVFRFDDLEDIPKNFGDVKALLEYVEKMQQKLAQEKGIKGKAEVSFTVNAKGKVTDIKVIEKDNDDAAKGAVTIVKGINPEWTPAKSSGKGNPIILSIYFE